MVPLNEQETVIQFAREGKECRIWTSDSTMITKLNKLCKSSPNYYKLTKKTKTQDGELAGNYYTLSDKSLLSLRSIKKSIVLTEEQKQILADRMRNINKNKDNDDQQEKSNDVI
jgi:hypothetical protein